MPPGPVSRHLFCEAVTDPDGCLMLSDREPFRFQAFPDNRVHVVGEGDTLWTLAGEYFKGQPRACGFWWAIADFQPEPIVDPTIRLDIGRRVVIPSERVLLTTILGQQRRRVH